MSGLVFDSLEDILVRLDGEDLYRCKSVCKSWLSLISSSCFVKTHLDYNKKKDHNNHELRHRRIIMPSRYGTPNDLWYVNGPWHILGSSNGLVCVSPEDAQVFVTNPVTREVKTIQPDPQFSDVVINRDLLCWGFGHDPSTDDYKVVTGIKVHKVGTLFHVLSLKSNIWEPISLVKYKFIDDNNRFGILWNGALHWFMKNYNTKKMVILSFDLSREEFNECPQPEDSRYVYGDSTKLGIFNKCLCIYFDDDYDDPPYERWVMKKYNDKDSWELLPYECEMNKNGVTHTLKRCIQHSVSWLCDDEGIFMPKPRDYTGAPIYVKSIVSPHVDPEPLKKRKPGIDMKSLEALFNYDDNSRLFSEQRRTKTFRVRLVRCNWA